ncbi:MAG: hypothetical protein JWL77_3548 [Chthonomonadaceae bacterium]|nr:hypothetical protein [Chthonomonadaceae bacterium]
MTELRIDHLTIQWPTATEAEARGLALLVTEELARAVADGALFPQRDILRIGVSPAPGSSLEALAAEIVAYMLRHSEGRASG